MRLKGKINLPNDLAAVCRGLKARGIEFDVIGPRILLSPEIICDMLLALMISQKDSRKLSDKDFWEAIHCISSKEALEEKLRRLSGPAGDE